MKKNIIFDLDWTLINSNNDFHDLVFKKFEDIPWTDMVFARKFCEENDWSPVIRQIEAIYEGREDINKQALTEEIYNDIEANNAINFFNWVPEKIIELSQKYNLYLTTWNSDSFAKKALIKAWIYDLFELVYGCTKYYKWEHHLKMFKNYSEDEDFFRNSVYVWDGTSDRKFAKNEGIDFIHIWNEGKDKYEIESVVDIDKILKIL
jgi:phosphoglycolate phosphatase-like HAD superfamily hydrolase